MSLTEQDCRTRARQQAVRCLPVHPQHRGELCRNQSLPTAWATWKRPQRSRGTSATAKMSQFHCKPYLGMFYLTVFSYHPKSTGKQMRTFLRLLFGTAGVWCCRRGWGQWGSAQFCTFPGEDGSTTRCTHRILQVHLFQMNKEWALLRDSKNELEHRCEIQHVQSDFSQQMKRIWWKINTELSGATSLKSIGGEGEM